MDSNKIIIIAGVVATGALAVAGFVMRPFSFSEEQQHTTVNNTVANSAALGEVLAASEKSYDFGSISMRAGRVSRVFQLKNDSSSPLVVNKVYTSCMCTNAIFKKDGKPFGPFGMEGHGFIPSINQTIEPGKIAEVEVVFDPAAHGPAGVGYIERLVYLETSAGVQQLEIKATVTP